MRHEGTHDQAESGDGTTLTSPAFPSGTGSVGRRAQGPAALPITAFLANIGKRLTVGFGAAGAVGVATQTKESRSGAVSIGWEATTSWMYPELQRSLPI